MTQLPPKVPNIVPQEEDHVQHHDNPNNVNEWLPSQNPNPLWVDEFMDFSAGKREAQRSSTNDMSMAFIETHDEFDKFNDEQFMSMFSTELGCSTSDNNSINDYEGPKNRGSEAESPWKTGHNNNNKEVQFQRHEGIGNDNNEMVTPTNNVGGEDQVIDPKRVKRILANRKSAQRSRVRKLQYISELEHSVTTLHSEVSMLAPRVAFLDHQRMILNVDNNALKAKIAALAQDKIFKDAQQEALKMEIERLRQVHYQQQNSLNNTDDTIPTSSSPSLPCQPIHQPPPDINENDLGRPFNL